MDQPSDPEALSLDEPCLAPKSTLPRCSLRFVGQPAFASRRHDVPPPVVPADTRRGAAARIPARAAALQRLATEVRAIERRGSRTRPDPSWSGVGLAPWRLGVSAIDERLGPHGLEAGALHEIKPASGSAADAGPAVPASDWASAATASFSFTLALLLCRRRGGAPAGPILWCWPARLAGELGAPHAPGLAALGIDPADFLLVTPDRAADVLWAMEEGLAAGRLAAVVGMLREAPLTPARRLALAAAAGGTPCLLITDACTPAAAATATRWRIGCAPSAPHPLAAGLAEVLPGATRYRLALERSRAGGLPPSSSSLVVEWSHASHCFRLVSPSGDRAVAQGGARRRAG